MDIKEAFCKSNLDFSDLNVLLDLEIHRIDSKYLTFNKYLDSKLGYPIKLYGEGSYGYLELGFRVKQDRSNGFVMSNDNPKMFTSISYKGKGSLVDSIAEFFDWEHVDHMKVNSFKMMGAENGTFILNETINHSYLNNLCNHLKREKICKRPRLDISYRRLTMQDFSNLKYGKSRVKSMGLLDNSTKKEPRYL